MSNFIRACRPARRLSSSFSRIPLAIVVLNVLSYYEPLRQLIRNGVEAGFINRKNESLVTFVDGPSDHASHETFDWGRAALDVVDSWSAGDREVYYNWSKQRDTEAQKNSPSALAEP